MVEGYLTQEMQKVGADLTASLDQASLDIKAALWFFEPEHRAWRLLFATPRLKSDGPRHVYRTIQSVMTKAKDRFRDLSLQDIKAVSPDDPLVSLLRLALRTGPGIAGIRFSRNAINGHLVEDAYIYRLN